MSIKRHKQLNKKVSAMEYNKEMTAKEKDCIYANEQKTLKDKEVKIANTRLYISVSALIFCFILFIMVIFNVGNVFSWFTSNKEANGALDGDLTEGKNISYSWKLSTDADFSSANNSLELSNMYPGSQKIIQLKIINRELTPCKIELGFNAPTETEEKPFETVESNVNTYYYLGSQLKISSALYGLDTFLITTTKLNNGQVSGVSEKVALNSLTLISDYNINGGTEIVFDFTITFTDNGTDQNNFQDFSSKNGACSRKFYAKVV